ncbi:MAG: tryptophan synthase subunit alpha [Phycisphaerales bacterium]
MTFTQQAFHAAISAGRHAIVPFICGGYPRPGDTERAILALTAGATPVCPVIEVGFPFSDPIADGPTIAAAMHEALNPPASGGILPATPESVMNEVARARPHTRAAIIAMVSYSILARIGESRFVASAARAGFNGFIVPDLPLEEAQPLRSLAAAAECSLSFLIAPTTPPVRAAAIARASTGFIYLLARTGVTGAAQAPSGFSDLAARVADLRHAASLPIACGFGVSTPADVDAVLQHADAAIVGTALVREMGAAAARGESPSDAAARFVAGLSRV